MTIQIENHAWLDKYIVERAAYYGMSADAYARALGCNPEAKKRA